MSERNAPPPYSVTPTPTPTPTTPLKKIRFVWNVDGQPQYGLSPLPSTFEDAVTAATRIFQGKITNPDPSNIILKCADTNRNGQLIWSSIDPPNWSLFVGDGDEVAVFERIEMNEENFIEGTVYIIIGYEDETGLDGVIKWAGRKPPGTPTIPMPRPKSFQIAFQTVVDWLCATAGVEYDPTEIVPMEFFEFHNDDYTAWSAFPPGAYVNDDIWRRVVPLPGNALGLMIRKQ